MHYSRSRVLIVQLHNTANIVTFTTRLYVKQCTVSCLQWCGPQRADLALPCLSLPLSWALSISAHYLLSPVTWSSKSWPGSSMLVLASLLSPVHLSSPRLSQSLHSHTLSALIWSLSLDVGKMQYRLNVVSMWTFAVLWVTFAYVGCTMKLCKKINYTVLTSVMELVASVSRLLWACHLRTATLW